PLFRQSYFTLAHLFREISQRSCRKFSFETRFVIDPEVVQRTRFGFPTSWESQQAGFEKGIAFQDFDHFLQKDIFSWSFEHNPTSRTTVGSDQAIFGKELESLGEKVK